MDNRFLETSPNVGDSGNLIGLNPLKISFEDLRGLGHPESYPRAIRAFCKGCCGGVSIEIRKCTATGCPLWPLRMGRNPFDTRSRNTKPATTAIERVSNVKTSQHKSEL